MKLPPPLHWFWAGWMKLSHAIGFVMSRILLTILWIVGIGIYALILKAIVRFAKKTPEPETHWIDATPDYPGSMKHQF